MNLFFKSCLFAALAIFIFAGSLSHRRATHSRN